MPPRVMRQGVKNEFEVFQFAFRSAHGEFTVHDGIFDFSQIALLGDAINLAGQGSVGYAGSQQNLVALEFHSQARNRLPLFRLFQDKWVRVKVEGDVQHPRAKIVPTIPLDEAYKNFLRTLETGSPITPRPVPPPTWQQSAVPRGKEPL